MREFNCLGLLLKITQRCWTIARASATKKIINVTWKMEMHHVQEHLIPCVSGMRWDKPPRCSCEERETIRISDKNASALSSRGGYCTVVFNGAGHHEISYRLEHHIHHCRTSSACIIAAATRQNEKTLLALAVGKSDQRRFLGDIDVRRYWFKI